MWAAIVDEKLQYGLYLLIAALALLSTAALYLRGSTLYAAFFGRFNPLVVVLLTSLLGFWLLTILMRRGWFAIYQAQTMPAGLLVAAVLAVLFAALMILFDARIVLPEDVNRPFPHSLLFYPSIGFVVEVLFHLLPLTLLLLLLTAVFPGLPFQRIIWPVILLVALLEPLFQTMFGFIAPYPTWVTYFIAAHIFLINVTQLALFKRYDFVTMYAFRLVYYFFWHILWGVIRLRILF